MDLYNILDWHITHYPLLQAEDIVKLVYQGVFGPGHLLIGSDEKDIEEKIRKEIRNCSLSPNNLEETEPIDPDGFLIRVNLSPIANSKEKQTLLAKVLKETAKNFSPNPGLFFLRLEKAQKWCEEKLFPQTERLKLLIERFNDLSSPLHHSDVYVRAYHPAYRVVLSRLWYSSLYY